jgi:aspartate carbamoyltransferase regulatory subunit
MEQKKRCKYCGKTFSLADCPATFNRQITCGSPKCMGDRSRELQKKRKLKKSSRKN